MDQPSSPAPRRAGATAIHSLDRFVFSVPDLAEAVDFYTAFGLDVRETAGRVDLYTHGHPHRWGSIHPRRGAKRLEYLRFGAWEEDVDPLVHRLGNLGIARTAPHPLADDDGVWLADPDGTAVQIVVAPKVSPATMAANAGPPHLPGTFTAPTRSNAPATRPRRLSHVLLFSPDVTRSVRFYVDALGLRLSDHSGDIIAFLHGAHASDHHMLAFAKSDGPGLHHSSWEVASIDEVGLGMQQMADRGHPHGWGVGRHVIGSNYFRYIRDPWGSFAEYSFDIDFIPADLDWPVGDHRPEDSFYVWGPPVPDDFIVNHETAARAGPVSQAA